MTVSSSTNNDRFLSVRSGLTYLLIGGGIGATVALLFAPKTGADLRGDIADVTRKGYDETLELAHRLKHQSDELYHSIRERADSAYQFAATKFSLVKEEVDDPSDKVRELVNGQIPDDEEKARAQRSYGIGRRPSSIF